MHIDTDQRPCAACGSTSYAASAVWDFSVGPRLICLDCYRGGAIFDTDGRVVRGRRLEVAARQGKLQNSDTHNMPQESLCDTERVKTHE